MHTAGDEKAPGAGSLIDGSLDRPEHLRNRLPLVKQHRLREGAQCGVRVVAKRFGLRRLVEASLTAEARAMLALEGAWRSPSPYGGETVYTRALLEDGRRWAILDAPVEIAAPVRILQGGADPDVPWRHALRLAETITGDDVVFTLIKDGDHRLSRPQDLARIVAAVEDLDG